MKEHKWISKEVYTCISRECDICGEKAGDGKIWSSEQFRVDKTKVKCYVGRKWPDDYDVEIDYDIDICPRCFMEKLVPWINSQRGGKPPVKPRWIKQ